MSNKAFGLDSNIDLSGFSRFDRAEGSDIDRAYGSGIGWSGGSSYEIKVLLLSRQY